MDATNAGRQRPPEKYPTTRAFLLAQTRRELLRSLIRPLVRWRPLRSPESGYTVIVGSTLPLAKLLQTNLQMLARQQRDDLKEVIVVTDCLASPEALEAEARLRAAVPELPLRFLYHSPAQAAVLGAINWAWCTLWVNWTLAVGEARTRHVFIQDLDAMILQPDFLQERYRLIRETGCEFLSVRYYRGNGIDREDRLAVTFEMMLDAAYLRREHEPIDVFNKVRRFRGRRVEFDTFLDVQARGARVEMIPVPEEHLVHPSQLICQYVNLINHRGYVPPDTNNLPLMPYFLYLAGEEEALASTSRAFARATGPHVKLLDRPMDASRLSRTHLAWLIKQASRLERFHAGAVRPEVANYFQNIAHFLDRRDHGSRRPQHSRPQSKPALLDRAPAAATT